MRIRIVKGTITKITGGNHNIYSNGDIIMNAHGFINETAEKSYIYGHPLDAPPLPFDDRIINVNGHFYNNDGTFEGKINEPDNEGSVNDVYVCDGKSTQKNKNGYDFVTYNNAKKLDITHEQFCYIGGVIKAEDTSNFEVAAATTQATFNAVKFEKGNDLEMSKQSEYARKLLALNTYSTATTKIALMDNVKEIDQDVLNARRGLIHVLLSKNDLSQGALLWDGIDFADEGIKHNKATKDGGISITKKIWEEFVDTCIFKKYNNKYKNDELRLAYGKHQTKKEVLENIPFESEKKDVYETLGTGKYNKGRTLHLATTVQGRQIFWKLYKEHENNKGYNWKYFMDHKL